MAKPPAFVQASLDNAEEAMLRQEHQDDLEGNTTAATSAATSSEPVTLPSSIATPPEATAEENSIIGPETVIGPPAKTADSASPTPAAVPASDSEGELLDDDKTRKPTRTERKESHSQANWEQFREARMRAARHLNLFNCTKQSDSEMFFYRTVENEKTGQKEERLMFWLREENKHLIGLLTGTRRERITTPLHEVTPEIADAMLATAIGKNWKSIKITGSPEFKDEIWVAAAKVGIEVQGHTPSQRALALLASWHASNPQSTIEQGNAEEVLPDDQKPIPETAMAAKQFNAKLETLMDMTDKETNTAPDNGQDDVHQQVALAASLESERVRKATAASAPSRDFGLNW